MRPHIFLYLNAKIANPSFDSQTKELLTTKVCVDLSLSPLSPLAVGCTFTFVLVRVVQLRRLVADIVCACECRASKLLSLLTTG